MSKDERRAVRKANNERKRAAKEKANKDRELAAVKQAELAAKWMESHPAQPKAKRPRGVSSSSSHKSSSSKKNKMALALVPQLEAAAGQIKAALEEGR